MRGKQIPEETKIEIAGRLKKESPEALATEYGVSEFSVKKWGRQFGSRKPKQVKRKVNQKENTRVSPLEAENKGLREQVQRLRSLLLDEILRNRNT